MNFRELTNSECRNTRDWIPEQAKRAALESQVLSLLPSNIDAYLQSGGKITGLPGCRMSSEVPRGLRHVTPGQQAAIDARIGK